MGSVIDSLYDGLIVEEAMYRQNRTKSTSSSVSKESVSENQCLPSSDEQRGRLACIEFDGTGFPDEHVFKDVSDLRDAIVSRPRGDTGIRRLFILEGLHDSWTTTLGAGLRVPPAFWKGHEDALCCAMRANNDGSGLPLPTSATSTESLVMSYSQLWSLKGENPPHSVRSLWCPENQRRVQLHKMDGRQKKTKVLGAVRHKVSFWSRAATSGGGWDAVIVVDAPFKTVWVKQNKEYHPVPKNNQKTNTLYQGGYADFVPRAHRHSHLVEYTGPERESFWDDLMHYHIRHHRLLQVTENPRSALLFTQKIVAAEYALVTQYNLLFTQRLRLRISRDSDDESLRKVAVTVTPEWVRNNYRRLTLAQHRLKNDISNIESIIRQLEWSPSADGLTALSTRSSFSSPHTNTGTMSWASPFPDFDFLSSQLMRLQGELDSLVPAFSVISTEHSLFEARNVRFLTVLGIVFLPLSFVATIFSMSDAYRPGGREHWMYWVVSVPLAALVIGTIAADPDPRALLSQAHKRVSAVQAKLLPSSWRWWRKRTGSEMDPSREKQCQSYA